MLHLTNCIEPVPVPKLIKSEQVKCKIKMSGRKKDKIWDYFIEKTEKGKTGSRAVCKNCKKEMQGLVQRLKGHHEKCKTKTLPVDTEVAGPSNEVDLTAGMF